MNTTQLTTRVSQVFGVSESLAADFLRNMDTRVTDVPEDFFLKFVESIPNPVYFDLPTKPTEVMETNFLGRPFPENILKRLKNSYQTDLAKYEKNMAKLTGRTTALENEININAGNYNYSGAFPVPFPKGDFGVVKPNRSRRDKYVYKFISNGSDIFTDPNDARDVFKEILVNIILQMDPKVENSVMKIYKVYQQESYNGYELILKLEALSYPLNTLLRYSLRDDLEYNKKLLLKVYGPLFETLQYLRKTYDFRHGDLHVNNLMLPKSVDLDSLNIQTLSVKMIDFGLSGLRFADAMYGGTFSAVGEDFSKEFQGLFINKNLPSDFMANLNELKSGDPLKFEQFIINEYKTMSGGRRNKTHKRGRGKKTRKHKVF
jgi:hypothetical protein